MTDLFSNEFFQLSLEDLEWEHAESTNGHAWETIAFKSIEQESQFFTMMNGIIIRNDARYTFSSISSDKLGSIPTLIEKATGAPTRALRKHFDNKEEIIFLSAC